MGALPTKWAILPTSWSNLWRLRCVADLACPTDVVEIILVLTCACWSRYWSSFDDGQHQGGRDTTTHNSVWLLVMLGRNWTDGQSDYTVPLCVGDSSSPAASTETTGWPTNSLPANARKRNEENMSDIEFSTGIFLAFQPSHHCTSLSTHPFATLATTNELVWAKTTSNTHPHIIS